MLFKSDKAGAISLSMDPSNPSVLYAALNEYAREGWELFAVTPDVPHVAAPESGSKLPMPRMVGAFEDAAAKLNQLGEAPPSAPTTPLLWVLRRAVDDDAADF